MPRTLITTSVDLRAISIRRNDDGPYIIVVDYLVTFDDGTTQNRQRTRTVAAGPLKTALDTFYNNVTADVSAQDGL